MTNRPPIITFLPLPDARPNRRVPSVVSDVGWLVMQATLGFLVLYILAVLVMTF